MISKLLSTSLFVLSLSLVGCKESVGSKATGLTSGEISLGSTAANSSVSAKIKILDQNGLPVANANVTGAWSGVVSGTSSALTATDGYATVVSAKSAEAGTFTFRVTSVTKTGLTYDSARNILTSGSISN